MPAEHGGREDPAERQQAVDAVLVDHPADKEAQDPGPALQFLQRAAQFAETGAHGRAQRLAAARIGREQEHRQDEDEVPKRRDRAGDAGVFAGCRIKTEERCRSKDRLAGFRAGRDEQHDADQHDHAAEITHAPGNVGYAAHVLLADEPGHHGIVENDGELGSRGRQHHQKDDEGYRGPRCRRPQKAKRGDLDRGKEGDPWLS